MALSLLQTAGIIQGLTVHPRFELIVNGHKIGRYTADFQYKDTVTGELIVEDVKSSATKTRDYVLRRALMLALHNIRIVEI